MLKTRLSKVTQVTTVKWIMRLTCFSTFKNNSGGSEGSSLRAESNAPESPALRREPRELVPFPSCSVTGGRKDITTVALGNSDFPTGFVTERSAPCSASLAVCRAYLHSSALGGPITEVAGLSFRGEREAPGGDTTSLNLFSSPRTPAG